MKAKHDNLDSALAFSQLLFNKIGDSIILYATDGKILEINEVTRVQLGYTDEELLDIPYWELHEGDTPELFNQRIEQIQNHNGLSFRANRLTKSGKTIPSELHASLVSFNDGPAVLTVAKSLLLESSQPSSDTSLLIKDPTLQHDVHGSLLAKHSVLDTMEHFRTLFELAPDAFFLQAPSGKIINCNLAATRMTGYSRQELGAMSIWDLLPQEERVAYSSFLENHLNSTSCDGNLHFSISGHPFSHGPGTFNEPEYRETVTQNKKGTSTAVEMSIRTIEFKRSPAILIIFRDITLRREAEHQLKLFERVFHSALEGILITDAEGTILAVNEAFANITGYETTESIGNNPRILKSDRHPPEFYQEMWETLLETGKWEGEIWNRRKNGEAYPERLAISAIKNSQNQTTNYVAVFHDITEMKKKEQQIEYQAFHDGLTGLPNRTLLRDRLSQAINRANRANSKVGLLFIDLDNFKNINDSLGHAIGDRYLQRVAQALSELIRDEDTVARQGGDEFIIILENISTESDAIHFADRLNEFFRAPIQVDQHEFYTTMSIGITFYPNDGATPEALIKNADLAMYRAKQQGKDGYRMFTTALNDEVTRRLDVEAQIRRALVDEEFVVFYQPKIDIHSARPTGMEALIRWHPPEGKGISPNEFIPIAEEVGFIHAIGERILLKACTDTKKLVDMGYTDLRCSVNISAQEFQLTNIVDTVRTVLQITKLPARNLELEITETTLIKDIDHTAEKLRQFANIGIKISIDDFGSGYSSLQYLKHFPIDTLKIDRGFIRDVPEKSSAAIVSTIIAMAEHMEKKVLAEGVETHEQLNFLLLQGCDEVQGYLFGKPMPFQDFCDFLKRPVRLDFDTEER